MAVTYAPGLIGAVLVGLSFAKSVAYAGRAAHSVHHIRGHIAANYLAFPELEPPFGAVRCPAATRCSWTCGTIPTLFSSARRATTLAGECFDKAARECSGCPIGGKPMDELAQRSGGSVYDLPREHRGTRSTQAFPASRRPVVNLAHNAEQKGRPLDRAALARDFTRAVSDELVPRAVLAARACGRKTLVAAGAHGLERHPPAPTQVAACAREGVKLYLRRSGCAAITAR